MSLLMCFDTMAFLKFVTYFSVLGVLVYHHNIRFTGETSQEELEGGSSARTFPLFPFLPVEQAKPVRRPHPLFVSSLGGHGQINSSTSSSSSGDASGAADGVQDVQRITFTSDNTSPATKKNSGENNENKDDKSGSSSLTSSTSSSNGGEINGGSSTGAPLLEPNAGTPGSDEQPNASSKADPDTPSSKTAPYVQRRTDDLFARSRRKEVNMPGPRWCGGSKKARKYYRAYSKPGGCPEVTEYRSYWDWQTGSGKSDSPKAEIDGSTKNRRRRLLETVLLEKRRKKSSSLRGAAGPPPAAALTQKIRSLLEVLESGPQALSRSNIGDDVDSKNIIQIERELLRKHSLSLHDYSEEEEKRRTETMNDNIDAEEEVKFSASTSTAKDSRETARELFEVDSTYGVSPLTGTALHCSAEEEVVDPASSAGDDIKSMLFTRMSWEKGEVSTNKEASRRDLLAGEDSSVTWASVLNQLNIEMGGSNFQKTNFPKTMSSGPALSLEYAAIGTLPHGHETAGSGIVDGILMYTGGFCGGNVALGIAYCCGKRGFLSEAWALDLDRLDLTDYGAASVVEPSPTRSRKRATNLTEEDPPQQKGQNNTDTEKNEASLEKDGRNSAQSRQRSVETVKKYSPPIKRNRKRPQRRLAERGRTQKNGALFRIPASVDGSQRDYDAEQGEDFDGTRSRRRLKKERFIDVLQKMRRWRENYGVRDSSGADFIVSSGSQDGLVQRVLPSEEDQISTAQVPARMMSEKAEDRSQSDPTTNKRTRRTGGGEEQKMQTKLISEPDRLPWIKLPDYPGAPRQDPVCASGGAEFGLHCWGGFSYKALNANAPVEMLKQKKKGTRGFHDGYVLVGPAADRQTGKINRKTFPEQWKWEPLPNLPTPNVLGGGVCFSEPLKAFLYVGGADYSTTLMTVHVDMFGLNPRLGTKVHKFDPASRKWEAWPEVPGTPRFLHATVCVGKYLYVLGGISTPACKRGYPVVVDNWRLDTSTKEWTRLRDTPVLVGSWSAPSLIKDRFIMLMGGWESLCRMSTVPTMWDNQTSWNIMVSHSKTALDKRATNAVVVYDLETDMFRLGTPMPIDLNMLSAHPYKNKLFMFAGEGSYQCSHGHPIARHSNVVFVAEPVGKW